MAHKEIRFLGDLQRLERKPGDVFVLTLEGRISDSIRSILQAQWSSFWDDEPRPTPKLLILDDGIKLGVVGTEMADTSELLSALAQIHFQATKNQDLTDADVRANASEIAGVAIAKATGAA